MNTIQHFGNRINEIDDRRIRGEAGEADLEELRSLIAEMQEHDLPDGNIEDSAAYYYYLGNAWALKSHLVSQPAYLLDNNEDIEQQIFNYRKAKALAVKTDNRYLQCEIYTNLANLFSHLGRSLEAQELYKACLDIDPSFMMAIGNRGFHLFHAARLASDGLEQYLLFRTAWGHLIKAASSNQVYQEARSDFARMAANIETVYKKEILLSGLGLPQRHYAADKKEECYNCWCAENGVFLNILNGVFMNVEASSCDSLTIRNDAPDNCRQIFNNLKQEYATARYFVWESLDFLSENYADRCTMIVELNRDIEYSVRIEKLKAAFRMFYSVFDKIAYLLNDLLNLEIKSNNVSYRTIWYEKDKKTIKRKISDKYNWPLLGLFWISKDLYDPEFRECIEPEARHLADIRNHIEHKAIQIVYDLEAESTPADFIYKVDYDFFVNSLFRLMRLSRSALFNLAKVIDWDMTMES